MRKPKTLEEKFVAFDAAMMRLYKARCCDCDLVGLDRMLAEARDQLARGELELVRHAVEAIAKLVASDVGTQIASPTRYDRGCLAALAMLDTVTSVVENPGRYAN